MNRILTTFVLLWSFGLQATENDSPEPDNIRLVGGNTRCAGGLQMKFQNKWKPVDDPLFNWTLRTAAAVCRQLDCGSAVSAKVKHSYSGSRVWKVPAPSVQSASALRAGISMKPQYSTTSLEITCSESVRLVNGTTLCSGRVEVKANQAWSTVCQGDFDRQDAEVVCRELGCGEPLNLQFVRNEGITALEGAKEFQCRGNESALLDCKSHESARNTCSPIGLTCSEPDNIRLVKGESRCTGRLEMKLHDEWKPVDDPKMDPKSAALVCTQLKCGFVVSTETRPTAEKSVWGIIQSGAALRECVSTRPWHSQVSMEITCSDLFQPMISISPSINSVCESCDFTVSCSVKPQYLGGYFQLTFTTSNATHNYTQKAENHTAHFLFPAANHGHQGNYSCVYHISAHLSSSESQTLSLRISVPASPTIFIIRPALLLLTLASFLSAICFIKKATRRQEPGVQENNELNLRASRAGHELNEGGGAQETGL